MQEKMVEKEENAVNGLQDDIAKMDEVGFDCDF